MLLPCVNLPFEFEAIQPGQVGQNALPDADSMLKKNEEPTDQDVAEGSAKHRATAGGEVWRRMYIRRQDLDTYGFSTSGCDACKAMLKGQSRSGVAHSESCRSRLEKAMATSAEGRSRLAEQDERANLFIARQIESDAATRSSSSRKRPRE